MHTYFERKRLLGIYNDNKKAVFIGNILNYSSQVMALNF